ncbi:MAG TPA: YraN family protein [Burkholderiales bacterium]|nr:YraN family protein [Burkholderiales bacterium]
MANGIKAERRAADYLLTQGLTLCERNFRCRAGEIDLVMRDGATLVFVEVRQRSSLKFGGAIASIDSRKQQKIIVAAQFYLSGLSSYPPCRFDALLIEGDTINWLRDAFGA